MHQQHFQDDGPRSTALAKAVAPNSFAAKMMAKMGYKEGEGLGATGKGRLNPIDAQARPSGAGLGAVKEKTKQVKAEEKREAAFRGDVVEDSSEEERRQKKERRLKNAGGAGGARGPRGPPKPKYRTAAEIEAAAEGLAIPNVLKSIIDATGHETRMISSTAGLLRAQDAMVPAETETMKLSRMAQKESAAFAEEWRALQERKDYYESQAAEVDKVLAHTAHEETILEELLAVVENLQGLSLDEDLGWDVVTSELEAVVQKVESREESIDIQEVAVGLLHPHFKRTMQSWDPLTDPPGCSIYLDRLKNVLNVQAESDSKELVLQNGDAPKTARNKLTTPYETMIYTLWLPPVRSAVMSWNVHQPHDLLPLIDAWRPLLPAFVLVNLVDQLVSQRLASALSAWKPKRTKEGNTERASSPIQWLFPWLPYLDDQHTDPRSPTGLLTDAKRKLKSSFSTWSINSGVFPNLIQWQKILPLDLPHMLVRYILPRLSLYFVEEFDVDPSDQDLKPLDKILEWTPFFSLEAISHLFADVFFKKWHNILYLWLLGEPDHTEIMQWYQWWKQEIQRRLPAGFNELPIIAACWEKGLAIINIALDALERNGDIAAELQGIMFGDEAAQQTEPKGKKKPPAAAAAAATTAASKSLDQPTTFKDVVEDWCAENGLLMFPLREADVSTGLPLFRITASASGRGGVVLYLKGDIAWIRTVVEGEKIFTPMALDEALVARAEK